MVANALKIYLVYNPYTQHLYHAIRGSGAFLTAPSLPTSVPPLPSNSPNSSDDSNSNAGKNEKDSGGSNVTPVISAYTTTRLPLKQPVPTLGALDTCLVAVEWGNERSGNNYDVKTSTFSTLAAEHSYKASSGKMVSKFPRLNSRGIILCIFGSY